MALVQSSHRKGRDDMSNTVKPRPGRQELPVTSVRFARRRRVKQVVWRVMLGAATGLGSLAITIGLPWVVSKV